MKPSVIRFALRLDTRPVSLLGAAVPFGRPKMEIKWRRAQLSLAFGKVALSCAGRGGRVSHRGRTAPRAWRAGRPGQQAALPRGESPAGRLERHRQPQGRTTGHGQAAGRPGVQQAMQAQAWPRRPANQYSLAGGARLSEFGPQARMLGACGAVRRAVRGGGGRHRLVYLCRATSCCRCVWGPQGGPTGRAQLRARGCVCVSSGSSPPEGTCSQHAKIAPGYVRTRPGLPPKGKGVASARVGQSAKTCRWVRVRGPRRRVL